MATADSKFDPKRPGATELFGWDFSRALSPNEIINSAAVAVEFVSGSPDANPSSMALNAPVIAGNKVNQLITGGINGNTYNIRFTANTSMNQVLEAVGSVLIRD